MARKWIFNPFTGTIDAIDEATPASQLYKVEIFTLSSGDISNKYVVLAEVPAVAAKTRLIPITGIEQEYTADFEVTADDGGKRLSWNSLGLESLLVAGEKIIVIYS